MALLAGCFLTGCKEYLNPHVAPEADAELILARTSAAAAAGMMPAHTAGQRRMVLTLNNAPEANEPLEQDFIQEVIELFEQRNPDIQIQYSPWQYSPESFVERARNGTLTDIIEVDASQMPVAIHLNAAADLTENVAMSAEIRKMNPEVFRIVSRNGRTFGVPVELHTMALFFNRRILDEALNPRPDKKESEKPGEKSKEKPKGKGAEGFPREFLEPELPAEDPVQLAQYAPPGYYYQPREEERDTRRARRGRQEVQNYYDVQPQQPQQRRRGFWGAPQGQPPPGYQPQQYPGYQQPYYPQQQPQLYAPPEEDVRARRLRQRQRNQDESPDSARPGAKRGDDSSTSTEETLPDDVLTTEAEARETASTSAAAPLTTNVKTAGLPSDWEEFIRLSVRLTNHEAGIFGYAPVLTAKEGGREFSQWAVQAGLEIQVTDGGIATIDVNTSAAADVAQFLKDLQWRYDITPPPAKSYYDNLMRMFAEGKLSMMMLPADQETIDRLLKLGMNLDDIGISALPRGPENRDHLTFGRCLIINSQVDKEKRAAAFRWLTFIASPEILRMREQFYYREQEQTGAPRVPLYTSEVQHETYAAIRPFRTLPLYQDYEEVVANHLVLEPPFFTARMYEAIATGVYPIIQREDSDPGQMITLVGVDFEEKYLKPQPEMRWFERYLQRSLDLVNLAR